MDKKEFIKKQLFPGIAFLILLVLILKSSGKIHLFSIFLAIITSFVLIKIPDYENEIKEKIPEKHRNLIKILFELSLAFIVSAVVFLVYPRILFDDAGFYVRYLENFSNGHIFCFNAGDGPVYGISAILFGAACAVVNLFNILSPGHVLVFVDFIGFFFVAFLLLKVFKKADIPSNTAYLAWLLSVTGSRVFLNTATSGMETPFHIAIILAAIWFFLNSKPRLMYLFMALAIVSKLDALPVIVTLLLIFFITNYKDILLKNALRKSILDFSLYFILPLALSWFLLWLYFGSILPQSAFAKWHFHRDNQNDPFRYISYFTDDKKLRLIFILSVGITAWHCLEAFRAKKAILLKNALFGLLGIAYILLYFFYKPGEIMMWYYAIPNLFFIVQIAWSLHTLDLPAMNVKGFYLVPALFVLFLYHTWTDNTKERRWLRWHLDITENERMKMGEYLGEISHQDDTLLSGHGHLSGHFKGYVLDISGLNSKLTVSYKLDKDSLISQFKPHYVVNHCWPFYLELENKYNYRVRNFFYDITLNNFPSWILLERVTQKELDYRLKKIEEKDISGSFSLSDKNFTLRATGDSITIHIPEPSDSFHFQHLFMGIKKQDTDFMVFIRAYKGDSLLYQMEVAMPKVEKRDISNYTLPVKFFHNSTKQIYPDRIIITKNKKARQFMIIAPCIEYRKEYSPLRYYCFVKKLSE